MPNFLAKLLSLYKTNRTVSEPQGEFNKHADVLRETKGSSDTFSKFDDAYVPKNKSARHLQSRALERYRAQLYRPPALAGINYPANPHQLRRRLAEFGDDDLEWVAPWHGRAIISPHIDYHRGGHVYAKVWRRAAAAVREAELVLIFGTDHKIGSLLTLTKQRYATPFGILPTDEQLIDTLAHAIGSDAAYASELNHSREHSIELSAVWLHYTLNKTPPCPVIPILCGTFLPYIQDDRHPANDAQLTRFIETLQTETKGKKVLSVASVDFAHMGPVFGDAFGMDTHRRRLLEQSDRNLIEAISQGDANRFYHEIANAGDKNRICGFSPIYLMLRYLETCQGREVAYAQCLADRENASVVSICGMLLE